MTPDERNVLQPFLSDLAQTRGATKDPEADAMIGQAMRMNPDAMYLLVQHAIVADQALHVAQAQIRQMEQQLSGPPASGGQSWMGASVAQQQTGQPPQSQYGAPQYGEPQYGAPPYGAPQYPPAQYPPAQPTNPLSPGSGLNGFLRTAGTMAAGVAGGEFLAHGLENLFSGRD